MNDDTIFLQAKLNAHATNKARAAIEQLGRALPCQVLAVNGALVQVGFQVQSVWTLPVLWLPKLEAPWCQLPTAVGDSGLTIPADTSLAGITQGGGISDLSINYGNLSTLAWIPTANVNRTVPPRSSIAWLNGPQGARLGDNENAAYVDANPATGTVTIVAGGKTFLFSAAGFTMSTGIVAETHLHGGVAGGSSDTGPPIA